MPQVAAERRRLGKERAALEEEKRKLALAVTKQKVADAPQRAPSSLAEEATGKGVPKWKAQSSALRDAMKQMREVGRVWGASQTNLLQLAYNLGMTVGNGGGR